MTKKQIVDAGKARAIDFLESCDAFFGRETWATCDRMKALGLSMDDARVFVEAMQAEVGARGQGHLMKDSA